MVIKVSLEVGGGECVGQRAAGGSDVAGGWNGSAQGQRWTMHRRLSIPLEFDADRVPVKGYVVAMMIIRSAFEMDLAMIAFKDLRLTYVDDDGDRIIITSDQVSSTHAHAHTHAHKHTHTSTRARAHTHTHMDDDGDGVGPDSECLAVNLDRLCVLCEWGKGVREAKDEPQTAGGRRANLMKVTLAGARDGSAERKGRHCPPLSVPYSLSALSAE